MKKLLIVTLLAFTASFSLAQVQAPLRVGNPGDITIDRGQRGSDSGMINAYRTRASVPANKKTKGLTVIESGHFYTWNGSAWDDMTGAGGSSQSFANKRLTFGSGNPTVLKQDSTLWFDTTTTTGTLYAGNAFTSIYQAGDSVCFLGNSIYFGTGASSNAVRATTLAIKQLGYLVEYNLAQSGTVITDQIASIPNKNTHPHIACIVFGYLTNEANGSGSFTNTTLAAGVKRVIDTCFARGWRGSDLVFMSIPGTTAGVTSGGVTVERAFNHVEDSVATANGCKYVDAYESVYNPEYAYAFAGNIHPNDYGHKLLAYAIAGGVYRKPAVTTQKEVVNGTFEARDINFKNLKYIAKPFLLGADSTGQVGITYAIPSATHTQGTFYLGGGLVQDQGFQHSDLTSIDISLKNNARILSGLAVNNRAGLVLFSSSGMTRLDNTYSVGHIYLGVSNGVTGGNVNGMDLDPSGNVTFLGNIISSGSVKYIGFVNGTKINGWYPAYDGGTGSSKLTNGFGTGKLSIAMSNGVDGTLMDMVAIWSNGRVRIQNNVNPLAGDIPSARLAVISSTEGFLPPVMTTTARNAISSPVKGLHVYDSTVKCPVFYNGTAWYQNNISESGSYTPTGTNGTNITANTPAFTTYSRTGNVVTVYGSINVTATAAVQSDASITLPIASDLTAITDLNGLINGSSALSGGYVIADASTDKAVLKFTPTATGSQQIYYSFQYTVQ